MPPPKQQQQERAQDGKKKTGVVKGVGKSVQKAARKLVPKERDYRWEELQSLEKKRRNILLRCEEPTWRVLLRWDGYVSYAFYYMMCLFVHAIPSLFGILLFIDLTVCLLFSCFLII